MARSYDGSVAFITGGSSGIGLACGVQLARRGARVVTFSIDSLERRNAAITELDEASRAGGWQTGRHASVELNVAERDVVRQVIADQIQIHGAPRIVICSAGLGGAVRYAELSDERFDATMRVNLHGTRNVALACAPAMQTLVGRKHIVAVSSMAGLIGNFGYTAYSASKFAVVGFCQSLRSELRPHQIVVSVLCPAQVDTPLMAEADKYKPPESKAVNNSAGVMTAEQVARETIREMERGRFMIVPGLRPKLLYALSRFFPRLRESLTERIISRVRR